MLTATFLSTLAGMYLPGRRSLIYETEIKFTKPIHPNGGKLMLKATVTEKQDRFKRITLKVRLTDTAGATVLRATMKVGVAAREEEPRRSPTQPGVSEDV